ncbi:hypothetical protein ACFV4E_26460 [Streptomyces hygroscopicus]|uniref:hypothetical protein n=1 Tax=Streptomyces hygroscopicus TaxID=1912 RepID=UPI0036B87E87
MEFLADHGVELFDSRERLKAGLSRYAEHRAAGPLKARFAATTWGQHMSILSLFYRWASNEGYATAEPFTYRAARALFAGTGREVKVNLAVRRTPKPHETIKYLEPDFTELFRKGLHGLAPDGPDDTGCGLHGVPPLRRRGNPFVKQPAGSAPSLSCSPRPTPHPWPYRVRRGRRRPQGRAPARGPQVCYRRAGAAD